MVKEDNNKKKTDKNNKDLKGLLSDWSSGKYDEDPGYLVDELRDLLESVSIDEGKDIFILILIIKI